MSMSSSLTVRDIMTPQPTTCPADATIAVAAELMRDQGIGDVRRLPVVEQGRPVGILSLGDLALELDQRSVLADISAADPDA